MGQRCKHSDCCCEVPSGRTDYHCSDYCKQHLGVAAHERQDCSCGHAACGSGEFVSPSEAIS
jgi:hypothetical protein